MRGAEQIIQGLFFASRPAAIGEVKVIADGFVTNVDLFQSKARFWHLCPHKVFAALVRLRLRGVADGAKVQFV
jgi:hypothetical protein